MTITATETVAAAAWIEAKMAASAALDGVPIYRDEAPAQCVFPHVVYTVNPSEPDEVSATGYRAAANISFEAWVIGRDTSPDAEALAIDAALHRKHGDVQNGWTIMGCLRTAPVDDGAEVFNGHTYRRLGGVYALMLGE